MYCSLNIKKDMKVKNEGNMYEGFQTWNPLAGECPHKCQYCSTHNLKKRFPAINAKYSGELRLDEKAMNKSLGKGNTIFVVAQNDLFADVVPEEFIIKIIDRCKQFPENEYFFQSKNPGRIIDFYNEMESLNPTICTTIESNLFYEEYMGNTPKIAERIKAMAILRNDFHTAITIEPIIDFDLKHLVDIIRFARPDYVNIGADSKNNNLPEPSKEKVLALINELQRFTVIRRKTNLSRLLIERYGK